MANRPWFQAFLIISFASFMLAIAVLIRPDNKQMGILQMGSYLYEEGEKRLLEAYNKNPQDLLTLKAIAELYAILGQPEKQMRFLSEYISLRPRDIQTRMELAKVYNWNLMRDKAMEEYLSILKYDSSNVKALRLLAESYSWAQRMNEAIDCYRKISEVQPLNEEDQRALIQLYIGSSKLTGALAMAEKMYRQYEDKLNIQDYLNIADLYSWTGRPALADTIMERMLSLLEMSWDLRSAYVDWYLNIGRASKAIHRLESWIEINDEMRLDTHLKLVEIFQLERKNSEAITAMAAVIEYPDSNEEHLTKYFWMLMDSKQKDKAWEVSKGFSTLYIETQKLWKALAYLAMDVKEWDEAKTISLRLMRKDDQDPEVRGLLFKIYQQQGFNHLAMEQLNWMLTFHGEDPTTLQLALDFLQKEKDYQQGLQIGLKAMTLFPDDVSFRDAVIYCSTMLKKHELAIPLLIRNVRNSPNDYGKLKSLLDTFLAVKDHREGRKWTSHGWNLFSGSDDPAYELAGYSGWFGDYRLQLERFATLEAKQSGVQYDKEMIVAAVGIPDWSYALSLLEPRSLRLPLSPDELLYLVQCYTGLNRFDDALELLNSEQAIRDIPTYERKMRLADILFEMKRSSEGMELLTQLYDSTPDKQAELRQTIVERALWLDNPKQQLAVYERFGDLKTDSALPLVEILMNNQMFQQAQMQISRLPKEELKTVEAQKLLRWNAIETSDKEAHLASLDELLKLSKTSSEKILYRQERSSLYHQLGKIEEAENDARRILDDDPSNSRAKVVLAYVHYDRKQYAMAAKLLLESESDEIYDRFLRGASLLRFPAGYREGMRVFNALLKDFEGEESFRKWNLVLDIGYEINSPFYIERAWEHIMEDYFDPKILPRYALHLLYTDRRSKAESIYMQLPETEEPSYEALQKVFEPKRYSGVLSQHEKMALADFSERNRKWFQATNWLP